MDKYIGKRIEGRYEITDLVGEGGMANVYKATDVLEQRTVAVKILKDEFMENEEFVRRFKNESKAIALLNHPNIVRVYDVSFTEKSMAIVMEYVQGITLKNYIDRVGALPWKDAVHFSVQILRALQHAHDNGIVHRDVKPQNIVIMPDGSLKVMDFGIARFSRSGNKTITDKAIGSVHYISPEQACGQITDEKSDIYSVGIVLYEMLTGKLPFMADSAVSVALMQMQNEPKMPREVKPDIPEGLEEIVIRAMQKSPDRRYQSAAEMLRDIDEFKNNPDISFEYKYFGNTDQATKYFDMVKQPPLEDPEEAEKKKNKKIMGIMIGVASGFILLTLIIAFFALSGILTPKESIELGDLRGLYIEKVKVDPVYGKLVFKESTEYSTDYEKGQIISHSKMNRTVKSGATIDVVVSLGLKEISMPDVYGLDLANAEQIIKKENLTIKQISKFDIEVDKDVVISTKPERNSSITVGSEVIVYVSLGAPSSYTSVPDLSGMTKEKAKEELEKYMLKYVFESVDSTIAEGKVVNQDIEADTQVEVNTTVIVQISTGKPPVNGMEIPIPIPKYMTKVKLSIWLSGELLAEKTFIPSQYGSSEYPYTVSGSGKQVLKVYIGDSTNDNNLFKSYSIDFDAKTYTDQLTNTTAFTKSSAVDLPRAFSSETKIRYNDGTGMVEKTIPKGSSESLYFYGDNDYIGAEEIEYYANGKWLSYAGINLDFKNHKFSVIQ